MKSTYEQTSEVLEEANVKSIMRLFHTGVYAICGEVAEVIAELVSKNSNDFTKDIATRLVKCMDDEKNLSTSQKQAWCIAYQIKNNIEVYKLALSEEIEIAKNL